MEAYGIEFDRIRMTCEKNANSKQGGLNVVDIKHVLKRKKIKHKYKCKRAELVEILRDHVYNLDIVNTQKSLVKIKNPDSLNNILLQKNVCTQNDTNDVDNKSYKLVNGLNYIDMFIKEYPKLYIDNKKLFDNYKSRFEHK